MLLFVRIQLIYDVICERCCCKNAEWCQKYHFVYSSRQWLDSRCCRQSLLGNFSLLGEHWLASTLLAEKLRDFEVVVCFRSGKSQQGHTGQW